VAFGTEFMRQRLRCKLLLDGKLEKSRRLLRCREHPNPEIPLVAWVEDEESYSQGDRIVLKPPSQFRVMYDLDYRTQKCRSPEQ
jgi:hypothetical protein